MKYFATIENQTYEIAIDHPGRVTVDGVELATDMQPVGAQQLYSLLIEGVSHEALLAPDPTLRNVYEVRVGGERYLVRVQDERSRRLALADRSVRAADVELAIKAPIPGLVVKVLVAPGQAVAEGDPVVILEAMKMENELRAPRAGVVHEVRIAPRSQVALGQVLVTLH